MEQLKGAAKILGVKVDDVSFTQQFVDKTLADALKDSQDLFLLAKEKPDEAPQDRWVYIRAHVGCFIANMLRNSFDNPLNFPKDELLETLKGLLTLFELNKKTAMLAQAMTQLMVAPIQHLGKIDEIKLKALLKAEFEKSKKEIAFLKDVDFEDQLATESGKKSYENALYYFSRIAGIYHSTSQ